VAPVHHHLAARPRPAPRIEREGVQETVPDLLLQGRRVPGTRRDPRARPDPTRRPRRRADDPAPDLPLTTIDLEAAIKTAAGKVVLDTEPLRDGTTYRLRWGKQVDTRSITDTANRDSGRGAKVVHPNRSRPTSRST